MKLTMISSDKKPGGIAVAIVNFARALADLDYSLNILIPNQARDLKATLKKGNPSNVTIIGLSALETKRMRLLGKPSGKVKKICAESDLVIIHNNYLCRAVKTTNKPVLAICHSDKERGLEDADNILVLSHKAEALFSKTSKAKIHRLGHYYETSNDINAYLLKPRSEFIVTTAGRMVEKKGFEDFIKAAAILQKKGHSEIKFWLAGSGNQEKHLKKLAYELNSPVEFKGWMDINEVAQNSSIFCLTSKNEPFGYVLCEMMAWGLPCITTKTNGPIDILDNGRAGLLYEQGQAEQLAEHILSLYSSPEVCRQYSSLAFNRIHEDEFSYENYLPRLDAIIKSSAA